MNNPKVSIVIVNWNGKEYLKDCLDSVFKQSYENFKVILVDNGSIDGSIDFVKKNFPLVNIIQLSENSGYAKGNNIGIKYAVEKHNPDYVLLLNNDTRMVQDSCLNKLIEVAESDDKVGIVGCKLIYPDGWIQYLGTRILPSRSGWFDLQKPVSSKPYEVDAVVGAVFLIKRVVIDRIGLLDEGFSPFYCEDMDYCMRVKKAGYTIMFVPFIEVVHNKSASMKKKSSTYTFFIYKKNSIRFCLLNSFFVVVIKKIFFDNNPYSLFTILCERRNKEEKFTLENLRIRNNLLTVIWYFLKSYFINIVNLKEIMWKRRHRTEKLWF